MSYGQMGKLLALLFAPCVDLYWVFLLVLSSNKECMVWFTETNVILGRLFPKASEAPSPRLGEEVASLLE